MARQDFVHIDARSDWTPGAVVEAADYPKKAAELNMTAVGLADWNTIIAFPNFVRACQQAGVQPLLGLNFGLSHLLDAGESRVTAIAAEKPGLDELTYLAELAHYQMPTMKDVLAHQDGLIFIADRQPYRELISSIREPKNLYYPLSPWNVTKRVAIAQKMEAQTVATNQVWRVENRSTDLWLSTILQVLAQGKKLSPSLLHNRVIPPEYSAHFQPGGWFKSQKEMWRLFGWEQKEALLATNQLAERVQIHELPLPRLPEYPTAEGETPYTVLLKRLEARVYDCYPQPSKAVWERITYEMERIGRKNLASTFLFADEFVQVGRLNGIDLFGLGSATGSIVNYILGITNIDPLEHGLSFDRFLDELSKKNTDTDWGIDSVHKDHQLELVKQRAGELGAYISHIVTCPKYGTKGAIREVMRSFGVSNETITETMKELYRTQAVDGQYLDMVRLGLDLAKRHLHRGNVSTHPTKIVITDRTHLPGFMFGKIKNELYLLIDKEEAEYWMNFDYVSSHALELVEAVSKAVGVKREEMTVTPGLIRAMFEYPIGIPYLETTWLREVLADYLASATGELTVDDLVKAISLSRPAASRSLPEFLDRLKNDGWLWQQRSGEILGESMGLIIYQEQVLEVAKQVAGFTATEANELRRGMSKERTGEQFISLHQRFIDGAEANGYSQETAEKLFEMMAEFAKYGFIKGHALSLILNVCLPAAYLKFNYPDAFFAQVMKQKTNFYFWFRNQQIYLDEWQRVKDNKK